ncbi:ferrous iron transport protein A [Psychromonas sp. B3M02]|uniref:FeoA family protein n=1 Tax=Psychromonas sp. B3M02 TaxID=2267226 RepID=UPI000DEB02E2|nr:FeoA family protein [Psychromonas sp. B3M02]RBW44561.1 ferrous iron transport protein A [Psychromonas sp. B3M02]
MKLSELKTGQTASIVNINTLDPVMRKKLLNLGFLPRAKVQLLRTAPLGDPLAIRCANSSIAVRKSIAQQIIVEY